jgi:hypothetical protein
VKLELGTNNVAAGKDEVGVVAPPLLVPPFRPLLLLLVLPLLLFPRALLSAVFEPAKADVSGPPHAGSRLTRRGAPVSSSSIAAAPSSPAAAAPPQVGRMPTNGPSSLAIHVLCSACALPYGPWPLLCRLSRRCRPEGPTSRIFHLPGPERAGSRSSRFSGRCRLASVPLKSAQPQARSGVRMPPPTRPAGGHARAGHAPLVLRPFPSPFLRFLPLSRR